MPYRVRFDPVALRHIDELAAYLRTVDILHFWNAMRDPESFEIGA
jgi:hypothetical protein